MTKEEARAIVEAHTRKLVEKWDKTGLLEGIKDDGMVRPLAIILEPFEGKSRIIPTEEDLKLAEAQAILRDEVV